MKTALILLAAAIPAFAQQPFDFGLLDKLGTNAKESTNITLDSNTLQLATGFLGDRNDSVKPLLKNLKAVNVRTFQFAQPNQYDPADLAPLRNYLKTPQWSKIVDAKEQKEWSEIYLRPLPNNQMGGLVVINSQPKEVNIVFIEGVLNMGDVAKLGGNLGIPSMVMNHDGKSDGKGDGNSSKPRSPEGPQ